MNPNEFEKVGIIEDNDVLYIIKKELIFCKNTTVPYDYMRKALFINKVDKTQLKHDLELVKDGNSISLGCLTTTMENCEEIYKNIKKIRKKHEYNKS